MTKFLCSYVILSFLVLFLHVVEFGVLSVEGNELVVSALFDDTAFVENADEVGRFDCR